MTDLELRAYLLGHASDGSAARLEEQLLEDEDLFAALRSAEDDLFDDYVRNQLTPADRAQFVARYEGDRQRVAFARALAQRTVAPGAKAHGTPPTAMPSYWLPLAMAATVVLAVGGLLFLRAGDDAPGGAPNNSATATPPVVSAPSAAASVGPSLVATLVLGVSRSAGSTPTISLPSSTPTVEFRVRLNPADRFASYGVELRSAANAVVWGRDGLSAVADGQELVLVARVPANLLTTGAHEVAVFGVQPNASPEMLGFVSVQVSRIP